MASICTDNNGNRCVQFKAPDGKRKTIYLHDSPLKDVQRIKTKVESLLLAKKFNRQVDLETASWLDGLDHWLYAKLLKVGLVEPKEKGEPVTLGKFIDNYIALRTDIKPGTRTNLLQARRWLVGFFGEGKLLSAITLGDADEFRLHLNGRLGENTLRRICKRARQFFHFATRKNVIATKPFGEMKGLSSKGKPERLHFIDRAVASKVLGACPDIEWKLIFALSRFGGLRCPSETLGLRWSDIDWDGNRITVRSPKTEHHEGKESRIIPLFPEIRPLLEQAKATAEPGSTYLITRYRSDKTNLRTQLLRIIEKAGLKPWPKLFQNLRSTRETELAETYPIQAVCQWIGNSETVAKKHYLQVTDEHFARAIGDYLQIPMHAGATPTGNEPKKEIASPSNRLAIHSQRAAFTSVHSNEVTLGRFEPPF